MRGPTKKLPLTLFAHAGAKCKPCELPPGLYEFEVADTQIVRGMGMQFLLCVHKIIRGPGRSRKLAGKWFFEAYEISERGAPLIKQLAAACFGRRELKRQLKLSDGTIDPEWLRGRRILVALTMATEMCK